MVDFGKRLRNLRRQQNMTQEQLAQRLNLTKSVISAYENDLRLPSYDVLISITRIFKVSSDYMLGISRSNDIDLSGLSENEVVALKALIRAMK